MTRSAVFLLVAVLAAAENAQAEDARVVLPALPCETVVLANGLEVFLAPDPTATVVSVRTAYKAGKADDPVGLTGLSAVAMFAALDHTQHIPSVMRTLAGVGASGIDATSSPDVTAFFETVAPERLETALWVESDRMGFASPAAPLANVESARHLAENAEGSVRGNVMYGAVGSFVRHELFPAWHPYADVENADVDFGLLGDDAVRAFLSTWYTPKNAMLAIAGRFDRDTTLALVHRYFDTLPPGDPPQRPPLPSWETPSVSLSVKANVFFEQVRVGWRAPAYGTPEDAALDLAAATLGHSQGETRLARALFGRRLAVTVTAEEHSRRDGSTFEVTAGCAPGVDHAVVVRAIQDALERFVAEGTEAEIERAKSIVRAEALTELATPWGRAARLIEMGKLGEMPSASPSWGVKRYDAVTVADARQAVQRWLTPEHRVVATVVVDRNAPMRGRLERRVEAQ
jgi:predicted Zn-dependent peptidase